MNPKTAKILKTNYYNVFPKKRDFFFLDSYEKIQDFKNTNFEDPDYICVISENKDKQIKENICFRTDFLRDFEFIKVDYKHYENSDDDLKFIISKNRINIGGTSTRLLTEIKNRPLIMKEIYRKVKVNFNTQANIIFKELFCVPTELKFFNRIFKLYIANQSPNFNPNQINNTINYNNNNSGYNNNVNININNKIINNKDNNMSNNLCPNNNYNNNCPPGFSNNGNIDLNNFNYSNPQNNPNNNNFFNNNINMQNNQQYFQNNDGNNMNPKTEIPNINQINFNLYNFNEYKNTFNSTKTNISHNQNNINGINNPNLVNNQLENLNYHNKAQNIIPQNRIPPQQGTNPIKPGALPDQQNTYPSQQVVQPSQPGAQQHVQQSPSRPNYIFSKKGLKNIGSTCYMNATLQCLLHVSELTIYFLDEYQKDQQFLLKTNNNVASGGNISRAFFNLVKGVNPELVMSKCNMKPKTKKNGGFNFLGFLGVGDDSDDSSYDRAFAPVEFKKTLGLYNPQFKKFEANDSKDLILYLLQTMHEELNYYGDKNIRLKYTPNQYNIYETYNYFITI